MISWRDGGGVIRKEQPETAAPPLVPRVTPGIDPGTLVLNHHFSRQRWLTVESPEEVEPDSLLARDTTVLRVYQRRHGVRNKSFVGHGELQHKAIQADLVFALL